MGLNGSQRALRLRIWEILPLGDRNATAVEATTELAQVGFRARSRGSGARGARAPRARPRGRAHACREGFSPSRSAAWVWAAPRGRLAQVRRGSCRCRAASAKGQHPRSGASRRDDSRLGSDARRSGSDQAPALGVLPRSWEAYESSVSPILSQLKWIGNPSAVSIPTTSVRGNPTTLV
jgi:hypothetical protein